MSDKVTILMNCYNGEKFLYESLKSIQNQTHTNWELIFWDNRSTDNSKKIFDSFHDDRFKYYLSSKFTHLGYARYLAASKLNGDYLAIIDTDDIWLPKKLSEQIDAIKNGDNIGMAYSNTIFFNEKVENVLYKKKQPSGNLFNKLLFHYNISLESILINFKYLKKLDHIFNEKFEFISDFDLVLRIAKISNIIYVDKVLSKWRMHDKNLTFERPLLFTIEKIQWLSQMNNDFDHKRVMNKYFVDHCFVLIKNNNYDYKKYLIFSKDSVIKSLIAYILFYIPFLRIFF